MVDDTHFSLQLLSFYLIYRHCFEPLYQPLFILETDHVVLSSHLYVASEILDYS